VSAHRNHLIDLCRIGSMLIVVVFHSLLWQVLLVDGRVVVQPWAPGPVFWAISWVATIIPIFFVAAGYANAVVVDTWRASGDNYGRFLTVRGSRLLGPLTLFVAVFTLIGTVAAWVGFAGPASTLSRQFAQLLWFAVVYLLLLGFAPVAVAAHDRFGGWVMAPLLLAVVAVDIAVRTSGDQSLQWLNLAFVWPLAHQWGIAYHRGWFRGWSSRTLWAALAGGAVVIAVLVFWLGYPPAAPAWADVLVANLLPPTLAITVLGFCQTCVVGLLERAGVASQLSPVVDRTVRLVNALLLSVYLWHIPAIVVSAGILVGLSLLLPAAAGVLMNPLLLIVAVIALVAVAVPALARVEVRLIPVAAAGQPNEWAAVGGYALFTAGVWALWQWGAVLHPADPTGIAAVALFAAGAWLVRRATVGAGKGRLTSPSRGAEV
jgi:hypothetical protein